MENLKYLMALVGAGVGYVFGEMDGLFIAVSIFIVIDYVTGVICAIYEHKLSSEIGFKGILKKMAIWLLIAIGNIIDTLVLKSGSPCRTSIIFFYLSNEGISILENISRLDVPIPSKIKDVLQQFKDNDK